MTDELIPILELISDFVWGPVTLALLLGTGIWLNIRLRFMPLRKIGEGFRLSWNSRTDKTCNGEITPFQALTTALSATVGTGNIAGVATAIVLGGPGAIFWMWITALFGMATKYSEAVLAVKYREIDEDGRFVGGPMYYIKNGLGPKWAWLAFAYALFATIAAFGIGNLIQANSIADVVQETIGVKPWVTGVGLAALTYFVIIGGIRNIARVAEKIVPFMAFIYVLGALTILILNIADIPGVLGLILKSAFSGAAATGGFAGATIAAALRFGIARGVFSNESGLGSAAIAHAASKTNSPVKQGTIAMLGTFIDTIIICTMTAIVILIVQEPQGQTQSIWASGETGAALSAKAFGAGLPGGEWIVTLGLIFFAFTTIIAWSYYGERAAEFIFGTKVIKIYRYVWVALVAFGASLQLKLAWIVADITNALMAIPNLIALLLLSGTVVRISFESHHNKQAPFREHLKVDGE